MPRHRWNVSLMTSRFMQACLLATWVALVAWKIMVCISEPTASEARFISEFEQPLLTVCPFHGLNFTVRQYGIIDYGNRSSAHGTLLDFFKKEGLSLSKMMPFARNPAAVEAEREEEYFNINGGKWTQVFNYVKGGLCTTFQVSHLSNPSMTLARVPEFQETEEEARGSGRNSSRIAYVIYIHRLPDFWGGEYLSVSSTSHSKLSTFDILDSMTQQQLVVNVEREVLPNMRRRPCVEDPSYSRSACWQKCFFDNLNCSFVEEKGGKPVCQAHDVHMLYSLSVDSNNEKIELEDFCSCPSSCLLDHYMLSVRPSYFESDSRYIDFSIAFVPVMRTIETYVTYGIIDLLADMGGFLGLLLGYSILSVFDDLKDFVARILEGRRSGAIVHKEVVTPHDQGFSGPEGEERRPKTRMRQPARFLELNPGVYDLRPNSRTAWTGGHSRARSARVNSKLH